MNTLTRSMALGGAAAALALLSACGSGDGGGSGGSGSPQVNITSPNDGASVGSTVKLTWDSSVELGEPSTGRDHVHVYLDGKEDDYTVVGGNEFTIKNLTPGEHTLEISLQHADHSSAGAEDDVKVDVGSGTTGSSPSPSPTDSGDSGYGY